MRFDDFRPGQLLRFGMAALSEAEIVAFARDYVPAIRRGSTPTPCAQVGRWNGLIASEWPTCGTRDATVAHPLPDSVSSRRCGDACTEVRYCATALCDFAGRR